MPPPNHVQLPSVRTGGLITVMAKPSKNDLWITSAKIEDVVLVPISLRQPHFLIPRSTQCR